MLGSSTPPAAPLEHGSSTPIAALERTSNSVKDTDSGYDDDYDYVCSSCDDGAAGLAELFYRLGQNEAVSAKLRDDVSARPGFVVKSMMSQLPQLVSPVLEQGVSTSLRMSYAYSSTPRSRRWEASAILD